MKHRTGHNPFDGATISGTIDPEQSEAVVTYGGRLRFLLTADVPQDVRALFEALCYVKAVVIDNEPFTPEQRLRGERRACL